MKLFVITITHPKTQKTWYWSVDIGDWTTDPSSATFYACKKEAQEQLEENSDSSGDIPPGIEEFAKITEFGLVNLDPDNEDLMHWWEMGSKIRLD